MRGGLALRLVAGLLLAMLAGAAPATEIVVTFGGDVNFARSRQSPRPMSVQKFGHFKIRDLAETLAPEWRGGDVNFINVETVVSERDGHPVPGKAFVFRSHPDSFRYLIDLGVNAFSLANNHAFDHGWAGMAATHEFFRAEDRAERPLLFAGIGLGDQAFVPRIITVKGIRVAMSAVSFGSGLWGPSGDRPGMAYLTRAAHYQAVLDGLKAAEADLKILSVHYGTENYVGLNPGQRATYQRALKEAGVDLVLGHHPHVARGIEAPAGSGQAIFYSLGNLLFIGGAMKDHMPVGHDFGLLGKAYYLRTAKGLHLSALEILPLKGVHLQPRPMSAARAGATLEFLNALSRQSAGADAAQFTPSGPDMNRGAMCFAGPLGPAARALCCTGGPRPDCDFPELM
ncbi:MAG: CapA family protein [Rhodobacteraceae bacterium]|nr:CapA family protein [Paracoccaceae bacterium]